MTRKSKSKSNTAIVVVGADVRVGDRLIEWALDIDAARDEWSSVGIKGCGDTTIKAIHDDGYARTANGDRMKLAGYVWRVERERDNVKRGAVGAIVRYCGHDATFIADIIEVGDACAVITDPDVERHLARPAGNATHHLTDFPIAGYWSPRKGVFVVPSAQIKVLK